MYVAVEPPAASHKSFEHKVIQLFYDGGTYYVETSLMICFGTSIDWFLYDKDLCHQRVKMILLITRPVKTCTKCLIKVKKKEFETIISQFETLIANFVKI